MKRLIRPPTPDSKNNTEILLYPSDSSKTDCKDALHAVVRHPAILIIAAVTPRYNVFPVAGLAEYCKFVLAITVPELHAVVIIIKIGAIKNALSGVTNAQDTVHKNPMAAER